MNEPLFNGPLAQLLRAAIPPGRPDPWPAEIDREIRQPTARPLCINCLCPQDGHRWFCPHCGYPSGDQVMFMPYLQVFCMGEALRQGVLGPPDRRVGVHLFLFVYSLSQYAMFAPVYWFWMLRKWQGHPICEEQRRPVQVMPEDETA